MTGSQRFPTGSRNHSHDRFPVPPLYRGTGRNRVSLVSLPFGAEPVKEPVRPSGDEGGPSKLQDHTR